MTSMSGTGALWRDAVSLDGGPVSSGHLSLVVGDDQTRAQTYAFTALHTSALHPRGWAQAPLTVANAGTADLDYRLLGSAATGSAGLGAAMTLRLTTVATRAACRTGTDVTDPTGPQTAGYDGPLVGTGTPTSRLLVVGASEVLCVRATLADTAPSGLQGSSTGVRLTFAAVSR
jgi:hypothetical protein